MIKFEALVMLMAAACALSAPIYPEYQEGGYGRAHHGFNRGSSYGSTEPRYYHHGAGHHGGAERYGVFEEVKIEKGNEYEKDSKYYYGGQYKGTCHADGLYYKDDTMFVMCSNGYPHEQPCPPGTKTSGSPSYKPGYYYGYTDLCSVNLVDYGLGPEHYAPVGYQEEVKKTVEFGGESYGRRDSYERPSSYGHSASHQTHFEKDKVYESNGVSSNKHVSKTESSVSNNVPHGSSNVQRSFVVKQQATVGLPVKHDGYQSPSYHDHGHAHNSYGYTADIPARTHESAGLHHHSVAHNHQSNHGSVYPAHTAHAAGPEFSGETSFDKKIETSSSVHHGGERPLPPVGFYHSGARDLAGYGSFGGYAYPQLGSNHPVNRPLPVGLGGNGYN